MSVDVLWLFSVGNVAPGSISSGRALRWLSRIKNATQNVIARIARTAIAPRFCLPVAIYLISGEIRMMKMAIGATHLIRNITGLTTRQRSVP